MNQNGRYDLANEKRKLAAIKKKRKTEMLDKIQAANAVYEPKEILIVLVVRAFRWIGETNAKM